MEENFDMLEDRVFDTLNSSDLKRIKTTLENIEGNTLCVGSGGSKVVADFFSLVLSEKNNCFCKVMEPRDVLYENINNYDNIVLSSYSGNNYGVDVLSEYPVYKYLLTYGDNPNMLYEIIKGESNK